MTSIGFIVAAALATVSTDDDASPRLVFTKLDLPTLRQRVTRSEYAPVWENIRQSARSYCDPNHADYADPDQLFSPGEKSGNMSQSRHERLLVHGVGRMISGRMEAIGLTYQITQDADLGRHGALLLTAFCERFPVTDPMVASGFAGGRGDIMMGLALGIDWLGECLVTEQRKVVTKTCAEYVEQFIREFNNPEVWFYRVHNFNGVNGGAGGCLAMTLLDDFPRKSPKWIAESRKIVERWLSGGFDADGAGLEGVLYAGYGLSNSIVFADALERNGMDSYYDHPLFAKLPEFYALSLLPGEGVCDARNDSTYTGLRLSTLKLAEGTGNGLYRWLWDRAAGESSCLQIAWENDVKPVDPIRAGCPRAKHFRGRGLCIWRTGWDRDDVMFSIEAGPYYPVTHNQGDKGHFTLYGLGQRWAVDTGYANEHEEQGRGQTLAHSCVLIDGQGQALSGAGWGTNGTILAFEDTAQVGYALVDATEAYNRNNRGAAGAGARRALRHAMFVYPSADRPAYAVICDDVQKDDQPHDYTWQMMISEAHQATLSGQRAVLAPSGSSGHAFIGTAPTSRREGVSDGLPEAKSAGECAIEIDVIEPGEYALWARVRTREKERGKSDSFFIKMDDGESAAWHMRPSPSWIWDRVANGVPPEELVYELNAGRHRLTVLRREWGAEMDCLLLTREKAVPPTLDGASTQPLFAEAESGTVTSPMRVTTTPSIETRLELHVNADSPVTLVTDTFHPDDYHGPAAFPRLRATTRAVNPAFMAVLLPLPKNVPAPTVTFAASGGDRRVTVAWGSGRDVILWPAAEGRKPVLSREK